MIGAASVVAVGRNHVLEREILYTTTGSHSWTCPAGVNYVSVVCIGGGGGGLYYNVSNSGYRYSMNGGGGGGHGHGYRGANARAPPMNNLVNKVKIPLYHNSALSGDPSDFISKLEMLADAHGLGDQAKLVAVPLYLTGPEMAPTVGESSAQHSTTGSTHLPEVEG